MIRDLLWPEDGFSPVSRAALIGWCIVYATFLLYAAADTTGFLIIDNANLMFHEAGHAVFGWAGYYTQILGGTLGQLLVPLICTLVFIRRGETTAVACCVFWGFENLLYIATYMGDARRAALPLVGSGESDWTILFSHWGVLGYDRTIASVTRGLGWIGMLATVAWLVWRHLTSDRPEQA
ncbi:MAG: hypothetical protein ACHQO8_08900 [Vicinamibacterales bacterium]